MIGEVISTLLFKVEGGNLNFFASMDKNYLSR